MRPKLLVWMAAPNPYWVRRLQAIETHDDFDLVCWFTDPHEHGRDWIVDRKDLTFDHTILPEGKIRRVVFVLSGLIRIRPTHLMTFHFLPIYWLALPDRIRGCRTAFYIEKTFDSWVHRTRLKELLKRVVFRCVSVIFVPGADAMHYAQKYAPRAAFRELDHVVDLPYLRQARADRSEVDRVRFLYLGRLVEEKGIHTLFEAFTLVDPNRVSLTVVGSGSLDEEVAVSCARLGPWARHEGFIQSEDLLPIFAEHDVLVFPTQGDPYGLVVNEALAAGMPVISSDAAGEIQERLVDGSMTPRGAIFPSGDSRELARLIDEMVRDRPNLNRLRLSAAEYADLNFGMNRWVTSIESWVSDPTTGLL